MSWRSCAGGRGRGQRVAATAGPGAATAELDAAGLSCASSGAGSHGDGRSPGHDAAVRTPHAARRTPHAGALPPNRQKVPTRLAWHRALRVDGTSHVPGSLWRWGGRAVDLSCVSDSSQRITCFVLQFRRTPAFGERPCLSPPSSKVRADGDQMDATWWSDSSPSLCIPLGAIHSHGHATYMITYSYPPLLLLHRSEFTVTLTDPHLSS